MICARHEFLRWLPISLSVAIWALFECTIRPVDSLCDEHPSSDAWRITHVPGFAHRVTLNVVEADLSAVRWFSALRRGLVVIVILIVGTAVLSPQSAINAATAALLIGLLDKGSSPRSTWRTMAAGTLMLCAVTLYSGLFQSPFTSLALLLVLAFCSGVSVGVEPRAPQIFLFGAILAAAQLVNPLEQTHLLAAVALTAVAGGLQTLFAWLSAPLIGDLPERQRIATAAAAVGEHCHEIGSRSPDLRAGTRIAADKMSVADTLIRKGDLAADHRARYTVLLADIDSIRLEARAYFARSNLGLYIPSDDVTVSIFDRAGDVLELAAKIIGRRRAARHLLHLDNLVAELHLHYAKVEMTRTAASVLTSILAVPVHLHEVVDDHHVRRQATSPPSPLGERVRASLAWPGTPLKFGLRMAAAALVGMAVANVLNLTHGSWVAVTAMMLLRPDGGPTAPRILMRAIGTTVGVAGIFVILWLTQSSIDARMIAISIVVCVMFSVVSVNYSAQTAMIAMSVILIQSLNYPEPEQLAFARWVDVLVGCVIGTAFAFAVPLWKRESLAANTAAYADAVATWMSAIAIAVRADPAERPVALEAVRDAGARARDGRQVVVTAFNTALLEPPTKQFNTGAIGVVLSWIRRSSDAGIAAETILRHNWPATSRGAELADATASDLRQSAIVMRCEPYDPEDDARMSRPSRLSRISIDEPPPDRVTALMARAEVSASAALRASHHVVAP